MKDTDISTQQIESATDGSHDLVVRSIVVEVEDNESLIDLRKKGSP